MVRMMVSIITIRQRLTSCRSSQRRILKVLTIKGLVAVVRKGLELVLTITIVLIVTIVMLTITKLPHYNSNIILNSRTHHKSLAQHKFTVLKNKKNNKSSNNRNKISINKESNK